MNSPQPYRRYSEVQSATGREYAMRAQDEQSSFYTDLQQFGANAEKEMRNVYDNYLKEVRAASAGDDAVQRAGVAYATLQREYGRIQAEYLKACQDRQAKMMETLTSLSSKASIKALDGWIDYLREVRQSVAPADTSTAKT
jgi:hypothetical protein